MAYLVYWKVASFHHLAAMPRITSTITLGARVCSNASSNVQVQVQVQVQVCRCRSTLATIANVQCAVQYLTSSYSRQAVSRKSPFLRQGPVGTSRDTTSLTVSDRIRLVQGKENYLGKFIKTSKKKIL